MGEREPFPFQSLEFINLAQGCCTHSAPLLLEEKWKSLEDGQCLVKLPLSDVLLFIG